MSEWEPKIVAFLCNWCSYGGADLAGVSRLQYPANIRVIRVPCSGRINPKFILAALRHGADGVWISGCHPGDCHYIEGNFYARRKFTLMKNLLEHTGNRGAGPSSFLMDFIRGGNQVCGNGAKRGGRRKGSGAGAAFHQEAS
jgi:coenzyme F420-reducing hydrogenase delta subunit